MESPEISSTQDIPEEGEEDLEEEEEEGEIGQEDGEGPTLLHPHVRIVESMSLSLFIAIFLIFSLLRMEKLVGEELLSQASS